MRRFQTMFLLFSAVVAGSCRSEYRSMRSLNSTWNCIESLAPPQPASAWYNASIDVMGKHISGLLLIKQMADSSRRVVFTNEAGVKFLDFQFNGDSDFRVVSIIPQLNKKAVVNLLRKDFELIMGIPFLRGEPLSREMNGEYFHGVSFRKLNHYYITDAACSKLKRIESATDRKSMTTLYVFNSNGAEVDSMRLEHHTFAMNMRFRKLNKD
jgi:hypothetical protein